MSLLLRYKVTAGRTARELWWTNQEFSLLISSHRGSHLGNEHRPVGSRSIDGVRQQFSIIYKWELRGLYMSPSIIITVESKSLRWAGYVVMLRMTKNAYRISLLGKIS